MELYKVTLTYKNLTEEEEWNRKLEKWIKNNPTLDTMFFDVPIPERKRCTKYVAIFPDVSDMMIQAAAELAIKSVVGPRNIWEQYQVHVVNVEYIGGVATPHEYGK